MDNVSRETSDKDDPLNLDNIPDGSYIKALCEDGVVRWGVFVRPTQGEPFLVPLDFAMSITFSKRRAKRGDKTNG